MTGKKQIAISCRLAAATFLLFSFTACEGDPSWGWEWWMSLNGSAECSVNGAPPREVWLGRWSASDDTWPSFDLAREEVLRSSIYVLDQEQVYRTAGELILFLSQPVAQGGERSFARGTLELREPFDDIYIPWPEYDTWSVQGQIAFKQRPVQSEEGPGDAPEPGDFGVEQEAEGTFEIQLSGPDGEAITFSGGELQMSAGWRTSPYPTERSQVFYD